MKKCNLKWVSILAFCFAACVGQLKIGQAQSPPAKQNVYVLNLLTIDDTKPSHYVWFLQKEAVGPFNGPVAPYGTAYQSLRSARLRDFVSHLPEGTQIQYYQIPLPDSLKNADVNNPEKDVNDFVKFCRSHKITFDFMPVF